MAFGFSPSAGSKISIKVNANFVEIKGAEGIPEYGAEKGVYETTSIADAAKTFGADLPDNGDMAIAGIWDSTDPGQVALAAAANDPAAVSDFKVEWAKKSSASTAASDLFSGLVLSFRKSAAKGGPQKFSSKIKLSGVVSSTAAA